MASIQPVWKPNPKDPRPLFVDISRHQGRIDFAKLRSYLDPAVQAIAIRAGIGMDYIDSNLLYNYESAARLEWPVQIYHVWHPAYGVSDHLFHLARLYKLIRPIKEPEGPPIADVELKGNVTKQKYSSRIDSYRKGAVDVCGRQATIYSRVKWLLDNLQTQPWMATAQWILAQYTWTGREHPGPYLMHPMIPRFQIVAMQTSQRGDGRLMGTESRAIDFDRWMQGGTAWGTYWHGS